jgi:hypothetical protein
MKLRRRVNSTVRRLRNMSEHEWHFQISLADQTGAIVPATVDCEATYSTENNFSRRDCRIKLNFRDCQITATDRDFFEALCRLREQLAELGLVPMCYGASRNVFPSGMMRDMANGLTAYRMEMGRRGRRGDAVRIFDWGADVDPVSVEIQRQFFDQWLQSFRNAAEQIVGPERG